MARGIPAPAVDALMREHWEQLLIIIRASMGMIRQNENYPSPGGALAFYGGEKTRIKLWQIPPAMIANYVFKQDIFRAYGHFIVSRYGVTGSSDGVGLGKSRPQCLQTIASGKIASAQYGHFFILCCGLIAAKVGKQSKTMNRGEKSRIKKNHPTELR